MDEMTWLFKVYNMRLRPGKRTNRMVDVLLARIGLHYHDYSYQGLDLDLFPPHLWPHPLGGEGYLGDRQSLRCLGHRHFLDGRFPVQSRRQSMVATETWPLHRVDPISVGKLYIEQPAGLEHPLAADHSSMETSDGSATESVGACCILPGFPVSTSQSSDVEYEADST
jgi:hypothetical protein